VQNSYYDILGVDRNASLKEIKTAFRHLAKKWHPDINPGVSRQGERFAKIHQAYRILSNTEKRTRHDAELRAHSEKPRTVRASRSSAPSTPRTRPSPPRGEPARGKTRPRPQPVAQQPFPFGMRLNVVLKTLKEFFRYPGQGATIPRGHPPRPEKVASGRWRKAQRAPFDRVFQAVQTRAASGFVLCSDGVIRRADSPAAPAGKGSRVGSGSSQNKTWRSVVVLIVLLANWWHHVTR
jgi:curved DNA-binding protein CbpA